MSVPSQEPSTTPASPAHPRRWLLVAAGLVGTASLGAALAPYLAVHHPLVLLALNPWPRHLILVAPFVPVLPFVIVATLRATASAAVAFEIGKRYGIGGLDLLQERSERLGKWIATIERVFRRASVPLLMLAPGPLTGVLAGIGGMRRAIAFPAMLTGQSVWVYLTYQLGDFLKPWTAPIMAFIQRYLVESTLVCAALVLGYQWFARRRRQRQLSAQASVTSD